MNIIYQGVEYPARRDGGYLILDMGGWELPVRLRPADRRALAQSHWGRRRRPTQVRPGQHLRVQASRGQRCLRCHANSYIPLDVRKINELGYMTR